jgi:hypothetical protein
MPSVGEITYYDPFTGEPKPFTAPDGGRGFTRPASLISLWSTAPFLQNNSVGPFKWQGSVAERMASFDESIKQMLWPENRDKDSVLGDKVPGTIDRTTADSYIRVPPSYVPGFVLWIAGHLDHRWIDKEGNLSLGPIPKGTPINLFSSLEIVPDDSDWFGRIWHFIKLGPSFIRLGYAFWTVPDNATEAQLTEHFKGPLQSLVKFSKCPDYVVNRGHYFGTSKFAEEPGLSDQEKQDLIEFLKTL